MQQAVKLQSNLKLEDKFLTPIPTQVEIAARLRCCDMFLAPRSESYPASGNFLRADPGDKISESQRLSSRLTPQKNELSARSMGHL